MIVVDTNVITYLLIPGDYTDLAEQALRKDGEWHAPLLWRSEFRNVIASHMAFKSMRLETGPELAAKAEFIMSGREHAVTSDSVLRSASASKCTAYDCEFITLAQEFRVPLVTTDRVLVKKFPKAALLLRDFLRIEPEARR